MPDIRPSGKTRRVRVSPLSEPPPFSPLLGGVTLRGEIRRVLAEHRLLINYGNPRCSCGHYVVPDPDATADECRSTHDAHLTEMLAEVAEDWFA